MGMWLYGDVTICGYMGLYGVPEWPTGTVGNPAWVHPIVYHAVLHGTSRNVANAIQTLTRY